MWVHAGIQEAEQEATREGRPQPTTFTTEEFSSIVPVDPTAEDEDTAEQRARLHLQKDLDEAKADGFSVVTDESFELAGSQADDDEVVEVVPDVDDWELVKDGEVVNPHDEQVKEDVITEERAKEVEDLNKILELTSIDSKPSGTSAEASEKGDEMEASQMSTGSVGSFKFIPSDDKPEETGPSENKQDIVDVDMEEKKTVEVDKPAGKPAEKKMPRPEKQKAPESKAMPRAKAPRLNQETDKALKKWSKPPRPRSRRLGSILRTCPRIPKECGHGENALHVDEDVVLAQGACHRAWKMVT